MASAWQPADYIEAIGDIVALMGFVIAFATFRSSTQAARREAIQSHQDRTEAIRNQRHELIWRQIAQGQASLKHMLDHPAAAQALKMLDWNGRYYSFDGHVAVVITWADMRAALRVGSERYNQAEAFIRDCFDALFNEIGLISQEINNELYPPNIVGQYLVYYFNIMKKPENWKAIEPFLDGYGYDSAKALITNLPKQDTAQKAS